MVRFVTVVIMLLYWVNLMVFAYILINFICAYRKAVVGSRLFKIRTTLYHACSPMFKIVNKVVPLKYRLWTPFITFLIIQILSALLAQYLKVL